MSLPPAPTSRHAAISGAHAGNDKRELRKTLLKARIAMNEAERARHDDAIAARLVTLLRERGITSLGAYWPIRNEPDLYAMYNTLAQEGVKLALPLVVATDQPLAFVAWKLGDELVEENFGIRVPRDRTWVKTPEAILAPCVGFNAGHFRLGYGGGFFDRTLAAAAPRPLAVGVAYAFQETDFVADTFDVPLDCIVTERGILG
jgi:5-formyltetrahydrofolate cyclo-ligase